MIQCEQVYDVKDHVNNLLVANSISCFIPQGAGIKVRFSINNQLNNALQQCDFVLYHDFCLSNISCFIRFMHGVELRSYLILVNMSNVWLLFKEDCIQDVKIIAFRCTFGVIFMGFLSGVHCNLIVIIHYDVSQEIDFATGTLSTIQSGSRKLLGKSNPVHALKVYDGLVYSASSSIEGTALKVLVWLCFSLAPCTFFFISRARFS